MTRTILLYLVLLVLVIVLAVMTQAVRTHLIAAAEFENAKADLLEDIYILRYQAERRAAYGWKHVAKDYLNTAELASLEELFSQRHHEPRCSYGCLALETAHRVRQTSKRKLSAAGYFRVTNYQISGDLGEDPRIVWLEKLWEAKCEFDSCAGPALRATTIAEVGQARRDFEEKKSALVLLLQQT